MIPTTSRYPHIPKAQTPFIHKKSTIVSTLSQDNPFFSPSPSLAPTEALVIATRIKEKQGANVLIILLLHTQQCIDGFRISFSQSLYFSDLAALLSFQGTQLGHYFHMQAPLIKA